MDNTNKQDLWVPRVGDEVKFAFGITSLKGNIIEKHAWGNICLWRVKARVDPWNHVETELPQERLQFISRPKPTKPVRKIYRNAKRVYYTRNRDGVVI